MPSPLHRPAAPRVRAAARRRAGRLRSGLVPVVQTALAAGAAYGLAGLVHERPFFAPVAAVVALGIGRGRRVRRAAELTAGVTLGIVVADLVVAVTGSSAVVVALVVGLAMLAAIAVGAGELLVAQAAVSAVIVATLEQPEGLEPDRAIDAAIGGAVALLVGQVLFPERPERRLQAAAAQAAAAIGAALREAAGALRAGDEERARAALLQARAAELPLADLEDAVVRARETLGGRGPAALYAHAAGQLGYAIRNVRVLARRAVAATRRGTPPAGLADAVDRLADALDVLAEPGEEARLEGRRLALEGAAHANRVLEEPRGLQTTVLVGQVRSTAVDLLRAAGVDEEEALSAVDEAR